MIITEIDGQPVNEGDTVFDYEGNQYIARRSYHSDFIMNLQLVIAGAKTQRWWLTNVYFEGTQVVFRNPPENSGNTKLLEQYMKGIK